MNLHSLLAASATLVFNLSVAFHGLESTLHTWPTHPAQDLAPNLVAPFTPHLLICINLFIHVFPPSLPLQSASPGRALKHKQSPKHRPLRLLHFSFMSLITRCIYRWSYNVYLHIRLSVLMGFQMLLKSREDLFGLKILEVSVMMKGGGDKGEWHEKWTWGWYLSHLSPVDKMVLPIFRMGLHPFMNPFWKWVSTDTPRIAFNSSVKFSQSNQVDDPY